MLCSMPRHEMLDPLCLGTDKVQDETKVLTQSVAYHRD